LAIDLVTETTTIEKRHSMSHISTAGIDELESKLLVHDFGVPVPRGRRVSSSSEISRISEQMTPPYVVKVLSKTPLHKSDIGGVKLGVADDDGLRTAVEELSNDPRIPADLVTGYLVEEMADGSNELIIGARVDPSFGPIIMVGAGGIYIHVFDDVSVRICPVTREEAREMLSELRIAPLLFGTRGQGQLDIEAIVDVITRIGGENGLILTHEDSIVELDINPLLVDTSGVCAVDVRIVPAEGDER
jgi:acetyl-CoA synthetase (ADP-forming)